jgi:hypothetical protein
MPQMIEPRVSKTLLKHGSKLAKRKPFPKDFPRRVSEKELHMHAWQWVRNTYPSLLIFHIPSGEIRDIATAVKLKRMGAVAGVADFLLFVFNCSVAIELKDRGGQQSVAQKIFQRRWEAIGNQYFIARSLDEFKNIIQQYASPTSHYQHP